MPNIAIYEGGKAARMNGVSRITTDDGNDGKITWVPQSDRQTGTLYVSENGTYRAEDEGLHSWSKVTVRLAGAPAGLEIPTLPDPVTGAEIPTGDEGELEPVAPAGLEPIEDEQISTDEAEKILEDAGLDPSDLDSDDAIDAIADALGTDPDKVKVIDPEKKEDVKKEQPKAEDKGQQATGTDPNTGEQATITPSGKEGAITPDELRIIVEPSKTSYNDGETIDYSGIQCALYKDGKLIRNARFDELTFPITIAQYDGSIPEDYTDGNGINAALFTTTSGTRYNAIYPKPKLPPYWIPEEVYVTQFFGMHPEGPIAFGSSGDNKFPASAYLTMYDGYIYAKAAGGSTRFSFNGFIAKAGPFEEPWPYSYGWLGRLSSSVVQLRDDVFVRAVSDFSRIGIPCTNIPESTVDPRLGESSSWYAAGQRQDIPVTWNGLSDTFSVMVKINS